MLDLAVTAIVIGIISPIVGWGVLTYQNGKNRGSLDSQIASDIKEMEKDIATIMITVGNGGYAGLKGEIHSMQVNCAASMALMKEKVDNLASRTVQ